MIDRNYESSKRFIEKGALLLTWFNFNPNMDK